MWVECDDIQVKQSGDAPMSQFVTCTAFMNKEATNQLYARCKANEQEREDQNHCLDWSPSFSKTFLIAKGMFREIRAVVDPFTGVPTVSCL
jgi:hypothetical protein